jgi:eukaryotic-like serine/threonine-protein kinase
VLMAQPFDAGRLRLAGTPTPVDASVASRSSTLSASTTGLLSYGGDAASQHLVWFDRAGQQHGAVAASAEFHNPALSPDERQLLGDREGIWLVDLDRGAPTRVAEGMLPAWAADGQGIVYTRRTVRGAVDLTMRAIAGKDDQRLLVRSKEMKLSGNWSRDGRAFVYVGSDPDTRLDIWSLLTAEGTPRPFLKTPANEMQPRISPDGAWLAYTSDETGSWEVYVQAFPSPGAKRVISVGGGAEPQWTRGGRELVYLTPDGTMMAVDVSASATTIEAGKPRALFRAPINGDLTTWRNHYSATADGQRFLVDIADERTREPLNVVVNWEALINR